MATAQVTLTDPAITVDMKIEAADGITPLLIAYWRTQSNPRTGVKYGFNKNGESVGDEEVVRRFFGQLYMVEVNDMFEFVARQKADQAAVTVYEAEKAKFPPIDYNKVI